MNVVVVAPHPDDETIGCGGAVLRHVDEGHDVHVAFLTSGELGLPNLPPEEAWRVREGEADEAAQLLGVSDHEFLRQADWTLDENLDSATVALAAVLARWRPDLVYTPHAAEWHPDHQVANAITPAAIRHAGLDGVDILCYEIWTPLTHFDEVEDISDRIDRKLEAVTCYASQLSEFDYLQSVRGLAAYRGALAARTRFAEVFARHETNP